MVVNNEILCDLYHTKRENTMKLGQLWSSNARCLSDVSEYLRQPVPMHYYEESLLEEIAKALGLTEYEVDQIRTKALRDLKRAS